MNCAKCNDLGWVCEKHSDKPQGHKLKGNSYSACTGAGMSCDCDAFPHRKKPREFWVNLVHEGFRGYATVDGLAIPFKSERLHVREVIELKTEELEEAAKTYVGVETYSIITKQEYKAFEAGARWAIAKMRGEA